ncbi:MAG: hypothetical protein INR70_40960 [Parafilimonas terrae]|nr:hypothetical protein [Parafilimonas terrae]
MNYPLPHKGWFTPEELATRCHCSVEHINALTRRHHWPRVHGGNGGKVGVDFETVLRAVGVPLKVVHGSVSG